MDSSGLYETNKSQKEICTTVAQTVACMHPGPHAILLVIKLDNVAGEDYTSYDRLKLLFDDHIKNYIIVLFTGGDELERKRKTFDDIMKGAPEQLVKILEECGNRSMVFNNFAQNPIPQVGQLFDLVQKVKEQNGGPYVCPKYQKIGESLEEETRRRLEEKPVEVIKDLGIMKEDIESKERKRIRQGELEVVAKGMTDETEPEIKQLLQKQDEQERWESRYEVELKNMKDRIAENQEPGFTGRLREFAGEPVKVFLKTVTPIRR